MAGAILTVLGVMASDAWAINKCVSPTGQITFQEAACLNADKATEIKPLYKAPSANSESPQSQIPADAARPLDKKRATGPYQQMASELEAQRLQREAADALEYKQREITQHRASCDQQQANIKSQKVRAANNLAGATWEQSISSEMNAAAARCDTRARELVGDLEELRRTCQQRGCVAK
jgi:hypothetical protein